MQQKNLELTTPQKQALTKQYIAFAGVFVLFFPVSILTLYIFNGSLKYLSLFLALPFLYIGISSVKNKVSILKLGGKRLSGEGAVIIGTIIIVGVCVQYLMLLSQLLGVTTTTESRWSNFPTYEILPIVHSQSDTYYHINQPSTFVHINTFEKINSWSNYQENPLIVHNDSVIIAGSVGGESGVNLPLLNVDIYTGHINWQTVVGSGHIADDGRYIYTQAPNEPRGGSAGAIAYNMTSGSKVWEATFDWRYAIGINYLATYGEHVIVQTYHRGKNGFYLLDPQTGETQLFDDYAKYFLVEAGTNYEWSGNYISTNGLLNWRTNLPNDRFWYDRDLAAPVVYEDLIFVKNGHRAISSIVAVNKTSGAIVWQFDESVVSNIAVGGSYVYFLTENAELKALDTLTGIVVDSVQLSPAFSEDFDFINNDVIIAADNDIVAMYFEDSRQLSIFRFENSN